MNARTIAILMLGLTAAAGHGPLQAQSTANPASPATLHPLQKPSAPPAPPVLRVTTRLVHVSVLVQDKQGNPISGLTKDDFVLLDGKKPQAIQFFSAEAAQTPPPAKKSLPPGTFTNRIEDETAVPSNLTVILLDSFNTGYLDQGSARNQVVKLLRTIQPQDRVALYTLGSSLRVLHEFTSDSASLLEVLKRYQGERTQDVDAVASGGENRLNRQLVKAAEDSGIVETQALDLDHSHWTAEALRLVANHIGSVPGRKNLVWVSGNFPFDMGEHNLQRTVDGEKIPFATDTEMAVRALANANVAVYPVDARGLIDNGPIDLGVQVYKGVDPTSFGTMEVLAQRTGGRAYFNTNAIMGSIRQVIDDSRVAYELGFYPSEVKWDGSFRAIRVKVNRPGASVQARTGYFALGEPSVTPDMRKEILREAATSPIDATGIRADVQVSHEGLPEDGMLLLFVSLDPHEIDFQQVDGDWNAAVDAAFVALDAKNRIIEAAAVHMPYALRPATYAQIMEQGLPFTREWKVPENATELRVIVLDNGNGKIGSVRIPLASHFPNKSN
jgi:VWFA-related protein